MTISIPKTDPEYLQLVNSITSGFTVNTRKNMSSEYMMLHRHDCPTITGSREDGAYTQNGYIKICGETVAEIEEHLSSEGMALTSICGKCSPLANVSVSKDSPLFVSGQDVMTTDEGWKIVRGHFKAGSFSQEQKDKLIANKEVLVSLVVKGEDVEQAFAQFA